MLSFSQQGAYCLFGLTPTNYLTLLPRLLWLFPAAGGHNHRPENPRERFRYQVELRKTNPTWDTPERRHAMNRFMARLIFCFFIEQMSDGTNTQEVISIFLQKKTAM